MVEEKRYNNPNKIYISVKAVFYPDGGFKPTSLIWEDGREYEIDRVTDIRRAASLKAGGTGIRYTCKVRGKEVYLFLEEDRWFMERKGD
ncbi:MAG: hypothetical protein GX808_04575 [Syntrophomonadaceae bacterium]|nr:hypothetical protein [Syntrophomonadaceae bacterium]